MFGDIEIYIDSHSASHNNYSFKKLIIRDFKGYDKVNERACL